MCSESKHKLRCLSWPWVFLTLPLEFCHDLCYLPKVKVTFTSAQGSAGYELFGL